MSNYEQIAKQAEGDLNTYQAKTGQGRRQADDEADVNSFATTKFENAQVTTGDELSTNRGDNRRIPESEGGVRDAKGRQTRGQDFAGEGGPEDKADRGGYNDEDVVGSRIPKSNVLGKQDDIANEGMSATRQNVGRNPPGPGGSKFKGEDYYTPESVPGSIAAEGYEAPGSVTEASKETEKY